MKKYTLAIGGIVVAALLFSPVIFTSHAYAAPAPLDGTVIHQSHIRTGGQTVIGFLIVEVGKGDASNCNDLKWLPPQGQFSYKDGDVYQLTDVDVIKGADKGYQCAIEEYKFNGKDVKISYNLRSDDNGNYIQSQPFDQDVDLE